MDYTIVFILLLVILIILIVGGIVMSGRRKDPVRNCRFRVEIDGIAQANPCEISGIEAVVESTEYREGTDAAGISQVGGMPRYGKLILKYGLTDSKEMYDWFVTGLTGKVERRNVSVVALDMDGKDVARWNLDEAWPARYQAPDFRARGSEVAMETFEIVYESLQRLS